MTPPADDWLKEQGYEPSYIHFHDIAYPPKEPTVSRYAFYLDLIERTVWTFVQAFLAAWIVTGGADGPTLKVALVAGGIAAAKSLIGTRIPGSAPDSGSWLPASQDPPQ